MSHVKKDLSVEVEKFFPTTNSLDVVKISSVHPVASYSWIQATTPTIAVPGSPPLWKNSNPKRVPADSGVVYIDQNSYRMGSTKSPLTPLFAAVDSLNGGGYDYSSLDIVSDRNNLRKLLRWATGIADEKDFRIDVELAGQTCLFTRTEERDSEHVVGFKGFGHEYEKAATKQPTGCERATGHHRIISIDFGGLKVLLRFEVDACTGSVDVDDLTSSFSKLGTSAAATADESSSTNTPVSGITCVETKPRKLVPQSSLIELKTRAAHRELDWSEAYPQLYLSQTAYLYLAKHQKGNFIGVDKVELGGYGMTRYAREAEAGMGKLREVLKEILKAVRKEGEGVPMSLVCQNGRLALYKRIEGSGKLVGKEILSRFT